MYLPTSLLVSLLFTTSVVACSSSDDGAETKGPASGGTSSQGGAAGAAAGQGGEGGTAGSQTAGGAGGAGAAGTAGKANAGAGGAGAGGKAGTGGAGAAGKAGAGGAGAGGKAAAGAAGTPACGAPAACEQAAAAKYDGLVAAAAADPAPLADFLKAVPKGGDLHNHLTGAVYAETYLDWAKMDGDCVNSTTHSLVFGSQCASNAAIPTGGPFYDEIVRAWSMKDFVAGAQTGHDHFFATFGKFGLVAGAHRDEDIADVLKRAASENQLYVETMFNLGKNIGTLTAGHFSGTLTAADLPKLYADTLADPAFATELAQDVAVVDAASAGYKKTLGCAGAAPPAACGVGVRFIAQVARTGTPDNVFGQLISAFEMAAKTPGIVGANLSSPEDDTTSLKNYALHMEMLDFLHKTYVETGKSPLHITLHAGELVPKYLPPSYPTANTFHIRDAVQKGHAERIGHGLDVMSETNPQALLAEMSQLGVLVEVCLSSNVQILEVSGPAHPLAAYVQAGVPVALGTDDQGVSRSSMAGEYLRAALDQQTSYAALKRMARDSLQHAFLPGAPLWSSVVDGQPVADCAEVATMGPNDAPSATCQALLDASERARTQWELERRYRVFESAP